MIVILQSRVGARLAIDGSHPGVYDNQVCNLACRSEDGMRVVICLLLLALVLTVPARAATVTFSDRTAWTAAAGPLTTIDFEGLVSEGYYNTAAAVNFGTSFTVGAVQFTPCCTPSSNGSGVWVVDDSYYPDYYDKGSGASIHAQYYYDAVLRATLPGGVTAVGFDFFTYAPEYSDGFVARTPDGNWSPLAGFFGVVSDTPIPWIEIATGYSHVFIGMDNLSYSGQASGIPEPSTLALLGAGLAALSLLRRKS
jgi:hypothetical protein